MSASDLKNRDGRLKVLGVQVDRVDSKQALATIETMLDTPACKQVVTLNPEYVMRATEDPELMRILNGAELSVPDGMGIVWASRILGEPLKGRITGTGLLPEIARICASRGQSLFLLGGQPGVAGLAAARLSEQIPGLAIAGVSSNDPGNVTDPQTVELINGSGADVLAVAYGCPKQDFWIDRNRGKLTGVRVAIGVGGALDFISGQVPRAPRWIRRAGMEWLFRLGLEPSRLGRMIALPRFGWRVLRARARSVRKNLR
ncbi:MAG: WecB/TagA/CpsF family glycosyltransferase [Actinobacteria bacterium]|nr:WecB/TagA/CpsF family glycosyltransferase [Actinomycetota bacterium]MCL5883216.1 WecB/TagA/CpsF family glycosyltransferase [Actinomycetota bacterium]